VNPNTGWPLSVGSLAVAWLVPAVTHVLRVDIVLLPLIVVGVASLLRVGSSLVDRLVAASAVTAGLAMVAGLVFSAWPWGLSPFPVAGATLTAMVLVSAVTGRRPQLPRRMRGSDVLVVGSGLAGTLVAAWPSLRGGPGGWLGYAVLTDDRLRHINLFDTIQQVGGYVFMHSDQAAPMVDPGMAKAYPSGMHFLYALVDSFVRSGRGAGEWYGELHRYYWYVVIGYGFFVMAVVWAARWVAGPGLAGWRLSLVCSAIGAFLATGVMTTMLFYTADAEVLGLALLAMLLAFLARPPVRVGEQVFLWAVLVVAVSFTYTLFLAFALVGIVAASVVYGRRLLQGWRVTAAVAAVGAAMTLVPVVLPRLAGFRAGSHFLAGELFPPVSRRLLAALGMLALPTVFGRAALRSASMRSLGDTVLLSLGVVLAASNYLVFHDKSSSYYFEKLVHGLLIVLLLGAAPAAHRLRARTFGRRPALAAVGATVAGVLLAGGITFGKPVFHYGSVQDDSMRPGMDTTWGSVWAGGQYWYAGGAPALIALRRAGLVQDGKPTLVIFDKYGVQNTNLSLILAIFNRNVGLMVEQLSVVGTAENLMDLPAAADAPLSAESKKGLEALEKIIAGSELPLRVVVSDPGLAARLRSFAAEHPQLRTEVLELPGLPRMQGPTRS